MTTQELINYYANLLVMQYKGKPRAYATIQSVVEPFIMDQIAFSVRDAYNIDTAGGVQLDVLGKYAGVTRKVRTFAGNVDLNDTDFRILTKMALVANRSESSLYAIQTLVKDWLAGALQVFDHQNMTMSYYFDADLGSQELAEAFYLMGMLPKPMGVQLASLIYVANIANLFGFRTYTIPPVNVQGFNTYADYNQTWTWLSYTNAIGV